MKDLELTVYPREVHPVYGLRYLTGVGDPADWWEWTELNAATRGVHAHRLSDAELAAECYRQMTRAIRESGIAELPGDMIAPGDAVTFGPHRRETQRLGTMHSFAALPHYDEVPE